MYMYEVPETIAELIAFLHVVKYIIRKVKGHSASKRTRNPTLEVILTTVAQRTFQTKIVYSCYYYYSFKFRSAFS